MMQDTKLYTTLALAGTIPFIAGALLPVLGHDSLPYLGPLDQLVASYGLAIVIQIVAFLILLFIDLRLRTGDAISAKYLRVRTGATMIAVASLLVVIARG